MGRFFVFAPGTGAEIPLQGGVGVGFWHEFGARHSNTHPLPLPGGELGDSAAKTLPLKALDKGA